MANNNAITPARPEKAYRFQADTTLSITPIQFQRFAEITKQHGCILDIEPFEVIGALGIAGFMAMTALNDASDPNSRGNEYGHITLAESWNSRYFSESRRPEMDWSAVPVELQQEFVLWHEIGHKVWNFPVLEIYLRDERGPLFDRHRYIMQKINEVLADRFAWNNICPGKPLPVRADLLPRERRQIDSEMEELIAAFGPVELRQYKPLPVGQYRCVSTNMLRDERLAAFVGPEAITSEDRRHLRAAVEYQNALLSPRAASMDAEQDRASALQCLVEDVYNAFVRTQSLIDLIAASNNYTGPCLRECLLMAMEYCHELDDKIEEYGKLRGRDAVAKPHQEMELALTNAQAKTFLRMALDCLDENGEPKEDADIPALMAFAGGATYEASCWLPNFLRGEEQEADEVVEAAPTNRQQVEAASADLPGLEHLRFIIEKLGQVETVLWELRSDTGNYEPGGAMFYLLNESIQAANKAIGRYEEEWDGKRSNHLDDLYINAGYAAAFADVLVHHDWSRRTDTPSLRLVLEDLVIEAKESAEKLLAAHTGEAR